MHRAQFSVLQAELQDDHCFPQQNHQPLENSSEAQDWGRKRQELWQDPVASLAPGQSQEPQSRELTFLFW